MPNIKHGKKQYSYRKVDLMKFDFSYKEKHLVNLRPLVFN